MSKPFDSVAYKNTYTKSHYDRLTVCFPIGTKQRMQERAKELGCITNGSPSISAYLYYLHQMDLQRKIDN